MSIFNFTKNDTNNNKNNSISHDSQGANEMRKNDKDKLITQNIKDDTDKNNNVINTENTRDLLDLAAKTDGANTYKIKLNSKYIKEDKEITNRLFNAGFSENQVQLVYNLAEEILIPYIKNLINDFNSFNELNKLEQYFGGEENFDEIANQITKWASKNLHKDVFAKLNTSFDGVISLYNMMLQGEVKSLATPSVPPHTLSEAELKRMMKNPKYWRDKDKEYIQQITNGWKELTDEIQNN